MNVSQLSKYMKSRMTPCIFCGKKITDNQEFQWCSTKAGRYVAYVFIHNDCIKEAQKYINNQKYADIKTAFHSGNTHADMSTYNQSDEVEFIDRASTYQKMVKEVLK